MSRRFRKLLLAGILGAAATFAPQQLFAFGEQGAIYDPSDFQRCIGGDVATQTSVNGVAAGGPAFTNYGVGPAFVAGDTFYVSATVSNYSGTGDVGLGGATNLWTVSPVGNGGTISANGTLACLVTAVAPSAAVQLYTRSTNTANFSNVRVLRINPAAAILYQDAAGTLPVTALDQPVGLMLDLRYYGVRGAELAVNGSCTGLTGWTGNVNLTNPGGATIRADTGAGGAEAFATNAAVVVAGRWYEVTFDLIAANNQGAVQVAGTRVGIPGSANNSGPKRMIVQAGAATANGLQFGTNTGTTGFYIEVDNVSIRELPGNHASQATAASRPTLSARVNKCTSPNANPTAITGTKSGDAAATFTLVDDSAALAAAGLSGICTSGKVYRLDNSAGTTPAYAFPDGYTTTTTNAQQIGAWMRATGPTGANMGMCLSVNGNANINIPSGQGYAKYTATGVPNGSKLQFQAIAGAVLYFILYDMREACDSYLPTQVVRADGSYDSVGFPSFLLFDGVDDFLVTGNIDLSAVSKFTSVAGVTKLSDAAASCVFENGTGSVAGNFALLTSGVATVGSRDNYSSRMTFTTGGDKAGELFSYVAPNSAVVSCAYDYSALTIASQIKPRANGGAGTTTLSIGDGVGTLFSLNAPFYLGRRAGSSLPLAGRLYGLILRAAGTEVDAIARAERWVAQKMGYPL